MSIILASSTTELGEIKNLLNKQMPHYRQAYSDRTSWIMACVSELAYLKFNPLFQGQPKDCFIETISNLIDENKKTALLSLIEIFGYDHEEEKKKLKENAEFLKMKLKKTFDSNGTQAILLANDNSVFLGFRGTEPTSMKDIRSDTKATTTPCESGGKIHSGFSEAFDHVSIDIQATLDKEEFTNKPLFITGHSLGGALATVAAKKLTHKAGIAACYTFGSPRVGDVDWMEGMKTPIYRVVNAADPVTMLPPGAEIICAAGWLFQCIPRVGTSIRGWLLSKFGGYYHCGDMRYLTNCKNKDYKNVKLLYSVSCYFRIKAFIVKKLPWRKILADHSIATYRKKLKIIACNRLKEIGN